MKHKGKNIFFISDTHFGHAAVIKYSNRPFESVEEMDEELIKRWNRKVKPDDIVIVVGDFFMYHSKEKLREILRRLNGRKILVRGNHDMSAPEMLNIGFDHVCESMTMKIANEIVNISHYPYAKSWWKETYYKVMHALFPKHFYKPRIFKNQLKDDGRILVHGHTHSVNQVNEELNMIHVGVDAWGYEPVPVQKIGNIISLIRIGKYVREKKDGYQGHE